jgi:predicted phage baseplate assembly protein
MSLQAPKLDDRKFQDIVTEARSKIPQYCPRWTDYNLSDPGITVIEMFAWMVDMLLYRLNRVPDKNYIKFMDMIGIRLEPPKPAIVNVTFRLSVPQPEPITIPHGTEVATVRTETQEAISFTTDQDFNILVPSLSYALTTADDREFTDVTAALKSPDRMVSVFQEVPKENNAFYLGFNENLAAHTLVLTVEGNIEGIGVNPKDPPWAWEFWDGDYERWLPMRLELDTTGGLNTNGQVIVHIPKSSAQKEINGLYGCWIRCRALQPKPGQPGYTSSPRVKNIIAESIGCTIQASQCMKVEHELLGRSKGTPGQTFFLHNTPVLRRESGETIEVETDDGEFELWQEIADFADCRPTDAHFTLDSITGEVQFGPSIKQPSGEEKQYGQVPPAGRRIRFSYYRSGGGIIGNVGEGTITILKSSIPYVDSVRNYERATGGTDAETLDLAKLRAPQILRSNTRAVTNEDFEYLALQASAKVSRAKCISPGQTTDKDSPGPGMVRVLLIPAIPEEGCARYIPPEQLEVIKKVREEVAAYLDERRLLGTRLEIGTPRYVPVSVQVRVRVKRGYQQQVAADIEKSLYKYVNPVCGGPEGTGLPFGRSLNVPEIHNCIQEVQNVFDIEDVKLFIVNPQTGERQEAPKRVNVPLDGVICSHKHEVIIVD